MQTNPKKLFLFYLVAAVFFLLIGPVACGTGNTNGDGNGSNGGTSTEGDTPSQIPSTPLPAGALKIVAMGDSLTEGDGDERFGTDGRALGWPGRLQPQVQALRSGSVVINLGRSGWNSQQLIDGQLPQAISENPNVACVWIGSNDLWYSNDEDEGVAVSRFSSNIDTILRRLADARARVYIALLDDQSKRPVALRDYDAAGRARMSRRVSLYNSEISRRAAQYGAATVDFFNTTIFTNPATLADDGNHPNSAGYDQIAEIWFNAIRPSL